MAVNARWRDRYFRQEVRWNGSTLLQAGGASICVTESARPSQHPSPLLAAARNRDGYGGDESLPMLRQVDSLP